MKAGVWDGQELQSSALCMMKIKYAIPQERPVVKSETVWLLFPVFFCM